jgi:hypothetical protein
MQMSEVEEGVKKIYGAQLIINQLLQRPHARVPFLLRLHHLLL